MSDAPRNQSVTARDDKRFRVAFSFAGEKREFVAEVAAILAGRFGEDAVLYDKFHEAKFARHDLGFYLPRLYRDRSDLIVPVLCRDYDEKRWTGWEWNYIHDLLTPADGHRVMPSRFDGVKVDGLSDGAGFIELDEKTPQEFADLILERLADNEGKPRDHYKAPARGSLDNTPRTDIPHNLPALQPFFGREGELAKIAEALDEESRIWGAIIDGPGGMGKTSLAVRAALACTPEQFARIVFVSLKSRELDDDGVRDLSGFLISGLAELLNELARELGHADIAKAIEKDRPRMLLDALRGTRTLLVLDNLESLLKTERDTVFSFVKRLPSGCKAILTSRVRLGSGAEELVLEKLSEEAALATLADLARRNPDSGLARTSEAERIVLYRETTGKPLLLRWTAGQIGRGSCVTFTDAIEYLRSCPPGNNPLEFIFDDLVQDFSEAETRALCALTYFTLPAKVEHIAGVVGIGQAGEGTEDGAETASLDQAMKEIENALKSLTNRSLAVPNDDYTTFTLVPLVADFLRHAKPELVAETGDRLEKRVYALVIENGFEKHERFAVIEATWPTVAAALPRFRAWKNERLQTVCSALENFLKFTGRWDELQAFLRDAERSAVAADDFENAGFNAAMAGALHYQRGQLVEGLASAERSKEYFGKTELDGTEVFAAMFRGQGCLEAKDYPGAIAAFRENLELVKSWDDESILVANALYQIVEAEMGAGDLDAAERDLRDGLRMVRALNYVEGIREFTGGLAELALRREDWPGAETLAREALSLAESIGDLAYVAFECHQLAKALVQQGRPAEGRSYAQRAVDIYTRLGSPVLQSAREILAECGG